jgi:transcription initiation factor TFIID TATA-box-binding protein
MISEQLSYGSARVGVFHSDDVSGEISELNYPYKIINIVALGLCDFGDNYTLNFDNLNSNMEFKRLNRFPCIMFKLDHVSCILFKNGKIILTGIKSHEEIPSLQKQLKKHLKLLGIPLKGEIEINVQNLVAMTHLKKTINLEMLCLSLNNCIYEPEQFPAAIVKNPGGKGVFLIFSNSKIIILGLKDLESLECALLDLIKEIHENDLFIEYSDDFDSVDFELEEELE